MDLFFLIMVGSDFSANGSAGGNRFQEAKCTHTSGKGRRRGQNAKEAHEANNVLGSLIGVPTDLDLGAEL
jgi:hypothetical protein